MKILIANDQPTAMKYIRQAYAKALSVSGYEVMFWDIRVKPVYDAFDEFEPDIFFGQSYNLNKHFLRCIEERPEMKLVLRVSDWSEWNDQLDKSTYPVLSASTTEIEQMKHIQSLPNPLVVHTHHCKEYLEQTHGRWTENGFNLYAFENFADIFDYTNGEFRGEYRCDLSLIGGYWGYKSKNIDKFIMPLCSPKKNYNIRIFGNQSWPTSKYCGQLHSEQNHILKSSKVCLSIHEPHSTEFGYDIVTRPFNLMSNKCFFVSDYVEGAVARFPEGIFCKTPEEYEERIQYYLKNEAEKKVIVDRLYDRVMKDHTAFERLVGIFEQVGLPTDKLVAGKQLVMEKKHL